MIIVLSLPFIGELRDLHFVFSQDQRRWGRLAAVWLPAEPGDFWPRLASDLSSPWSALLCCFSLGGGGGIRAVALVDMGLELGARDAALGKRSQRHQEEGRG